MSFQRAFTLPSGMMTVFSYARILYIRIYLLSFMWSEMLSSSHNAMLTLSKTLSPQKSVPIQSDWLSHRSSPTSLVIFAERRPSNGMTYECHAAAIGYKALPRYPTALDTVILGYSLYRMLLSSYTCPPPPCLLYISFNAGTFRVDGYLV